MKPKYRYIFTTAQNQAGLHSGFVRNLEAFIKENQVDKVFIFAVKGKDVFDNKPILDKSGEPINKYGIHDKIKALIQNGLAGADVEIIYETPKKGIKLNDNLSYFHNQMLPQVVDPFRGLAPKLPRDRSYIVNATKVRFEVIGTNNPQSPRTMTSTGAITVPRYRTNVQTGVKALEMHTYGFTYVEIFNNKRFMTHPIIANSTGNFTHLDKKYHNGKVSNTRIKALILGDLHRAVMDKGAVSESRKQIRELKPKFVVLHDFHDGKSINHHEAKNFLSQISRRVKQYDELEKELKDDLAFLKRLANDFPDVKFLIVESNHDEFIRKYINDKLFIKDTQNILFISRLLDKIVYNKSNKPILQTALEAVGKIPKNVKFLKQDEDYRIGGYLVSMHGHKGLNGSRGSYKTYERHNIKIVNGHEHTLRLFSNGATAGHLTDLSKQEYAKGGVTKWLQGNVSIDEYNTLHIHILENNFKK